MKRMSGALTLARRDVRGEGEAVPGVDALIAALATRARPGDHVVFMSNGGFEGAPRRFLATLAG